jgi:predicted RNA-binding Zn-ribbon protein involved in translation (DUF1610 family)
MGKMACCEDFDYYINIKCEIHDNIYECPDYLITYNASDDSYGLIIHDGGESSVKIAYCPWCGNKLSLRGERDYGA